MSNKYNPSHATYIKSPKIIQSRGQIAISRVLSQTQIVDS